VALREVDDARADGGEAHERAGAGVPQLRVEALLLCADIVHAVAISIVRTPPEAVKQTNRFPGEERPPVRKAERERNAHLPPAAAAARCWPRTTSSCPTAGRGNQNLISTTTPSPIHPPPPQIGRILQQVTHASDEGGQTQEAVRGETEGDASPRPLSRARRSPP
jgi:hypothetical protein